VIKRTIQVDNDINGIVSNSMTLSNGAGEFLSAGSDEFCFEAHGRKITGRNNWKSYSMYMTTGWYDHIKGVILNLVKEHGLEYIKGDFAVVTGAYTTDKTRSGCHAKDLPWVNCLQTQQVRSFLRRDFG